MTTDASSYQHHYGSDMGPRPYQADAAGHHEAAGRSAWAVADGVGNHPDAPAAARHAVTTATKTAAATGDAMLGVEAARAALLAAYDQGFRGNCTLVVAATTAEGIDIAWVGDTRAYDISGDTIRQLTVDHNAGTLLRSQGVQVPDSSHLFNLLTSHLREGEIGRTHVPATTQRLLLCTDGIHRVLEPGGLLASAARRFRSRPAALTHRLMLAVRNCGPVDNATALVIQAA